MIVVEHFLCFSYWKDTSELPPFFDFYIGWRDVGVKVFGWWIFFPSRRKKK